ncbi:hypothetical protein [Thermomonospora curvata]|uniref:Uncharacterized protein n=1 Tax=Thermomonospora curvata (strain ATCC 19995 / DSM 43183 / JCM 3096 / KCTC 9072 / NBRC 15933 / NCIMB 10081 / Henssen B9) TaxID=471852 RepID=D1A4U0_THECD|nr:hypothetical protein [Thermomonospora curvata]ACY98109.1 hypothetical protein Tcur_2548 [Thermomonospora curvata DSM 43183]
MRTTLRRIGADIRRLRHIDAYVISAIAICLAILSVIGELVPEQVRWAGVFAGLSLLVYRTTLPEEVRASAKAPVGDRRDLETLRVSERLRTARTLWMYAPSAVNFLTQERCDVLRSGILARSDGEVRFVVLDPEATAALELAGRQLDESVEFPVHRLGPSLESSLQRLETMASWNNVAGTMEYRLLDYNPGLSLMFIDPHSPDGLAVVEIHGCHGESTSSRMHLRLTPMDNPHWFQRWIAQFEYLWTRARPPSSAS